MSNEPKPRNHAAGSYRPTMTCRMVESVRQRLLDACEVSGRSLSEEIEQRVVQSFLTEDLTRSIREQIRQEMRAEFDARMPFEAVELDWMKRQAAAGVSNEAYMHAACAEYIQSNVKS